MNGDHDTKENEEKEEPDLHPGIRRVLAKQRNDKQRAQGMSTTLSPNPTSIPQLLNFSTHQPLNPSTPPVP